MKDKEDRVIYVGKAKKLKNRVSQYFQDTAAHSAKTRRMVSLVDHFETIGAATEFEALVLECALIKHYMPKYNILLKDDKGYPYLRLDLREEYPSIRLSNRPQEDGARYFGPYGSRGKSTQVIETIQSVFQLPKCKRKFPADIGKDRPCLNFQMGVCAGWCRPELSREEYRARMEQALLLLEGKHQHLSRELRQQMEAAAEELAFEKAAMYRDRLQAVSLLSRKQLVSAGATADTDVIGWHETEAKACFAVLHYVKGQLVDKDYQLLQLPDDPSEALSALVKQYYLARGTAPKRILLPFFMEDGTPFSQLLSEKLGKTVRLQVPQRGDNRKLVELANRNAKEEAERATTAAERLRGSLRQLERLLRLPAYPARIEAYDISNIAGTDIVASMTVFVEGKAKKKDYKRFRLEGMEDQNDYAAMEQVLCRRFCHYLNGDEGFREKPDLLLIDGGSTHALTVKRALNAMGLTFPIFGMVKDHRHRTRGLITPEGEELGIQTQTNLFALIGRIQEETHRFAISYHRSLRSKRLKGSRLDEIPGVGEKRRGALLKHFKSIRAIEEATVEMLGQVVPESTAKAIYAYFHPEG